MIAALAVPRHLAVEDHSFAGIAAIALVDRREVLRQPVARIQLHIAAALVGEQPDAVELALEQPVVAREALLRQRRGHRLEPVGHLDL